MKTTITFNLDKELKNKLQFYCIKNNTNITDELVKAIEKITKGE